MEEETVEQAADNYSPQPDEDYHYINCDYTLADICRVERAAFKAGALWQATIAQEN